MKICIILWALAAVTSAGVVSPLGYAPGSYLTHAPAFDSAVIKSDQIGGNFAYSVATKHAYAAHVTSPVGVSYNAPTLFQQRLPAIAAYHQPEQFASTYHQAAITRPVAFSPYAQPAAVQTYLRPSAIQTYGQPGVIQSYQRAPVFQTFAQPAAIQTQTFAQPAAVQSNPRPEAIQTNVQPEPTSLSSYSPLPLSQFAPSNIQTTAISSSSPFASTNFANNIYTVHSNAGTYNTLANNYNNNDFGYSTNTNTYFG